MLSRAIKSVLNQTYKEIELIVVDDNPKGSKYRKEIQENIKDLLGNKIKYVQHERNMGACKARNTGIKYSKGDYIAFLDDDDEWITNKLEMQIEKMNDPKVGLVYCSSRVIYTNGNKIIGTDLRSFRKSGYVFNELLKENFIGSTSCQLIRKKVIDDCGGFNETLQSSQDYELWLRITQRYKVDFVDIPLVNYYVHNGERISTNISKKIQGILRVNELYYEHLEKNSNALTYRLLKLSSYYIKDGQYKNGIKNYLKAIKCSPIYCLDLTKNKILKIWREIAK